MIERPDELLWELPRAESADDVPAPADALLTAYRDGRMDPAEQARLEWDLAASRRGRARLAELAGVRLDAKPRESAFPGRAVAAILLTAASLGLVAWLAVRPGTTTLPDFDVRAEGLAAERGAPGGTTALAETLVRIAVEPRESAIPDVRFAAYRRDGDELIRLAEPSEVVIDVDRGSAVLTAQARRLVGPDPGTRPFFVVVTAKSGLPPRLALDRGDPEAALKRSTSGNVYPVSLTIVETIQGAP
jgi:hypothetical protein